MWIPSSKNYSAIFIPTMFGLIVVVTIFANQTIAAFTLERILHDFVARQANYPISMRVFLDPAEFQLNLRNRCRWLGLRDCLNSSHFPKRVINQSS